MCEVDATRCVQPDSLAQQLLLLLPNPQAETLHSALMIYMLAFVNNDLQLGETATGKHTLHSSSIKRAVLEKLLIEWAPR